MQGQGLSARTITERIRVITQIAATTGTDPAALTPQTISTSTHSRPKAAGRAYEKGGQSQKVSTHSRPKAAGSS